MWKSEYKGKGKRKKEKVRTLCALNRRVCSSPASRVLLLFCLLPFSFLLSGCRRDMQDQPKAIAYRESAFYKDGNASRQLIEGTVPRGFLRADREYYFGKKAVYGTGSGSDRVTNSTGPQPGASTNPGAMFPDDVETLPFPITKEILDRGQDRYQIFCSSCHGLTGNGDGIIARRGFNKPSPASLHQDKLRQAPVGHFFDVITNGWGAMPSHAAQIPVADRWKIIAYVRALQLSQMPAQSSTATQPSSIKPAAADTRAPGRTK
jgi:hypothetical protein